MSTHNPTITEANHLVESSDGDFTLRDLFAAAYLSGMFGNTDVDITSDCDIFAEAAYLLADAMLEARTK